MTRNEKPIETLDRLDPTLPLAVFLVGGDNDLGPASLLLFRSVHAADFTQVLFVSVGVMDYGVLDAGADPSRGFEGPEESGRLRERTRRKLDVFVSEARRLGLKAGARVTIATDPVAEIDALAGILAAEYPKAVFFLSKMVFRKRRWFHQLLHGGTADALERVLQRRGLQVRVLPIVLSA